MNNKRQIPWNKGLKNVCKANAGSFKKGLIPWNKNKRQENTANEKAYQWKGIDAGYRAKHRWIAKILGKADHCEVCGADEIPKEYKRFFQWANIDHKYSRNTEDYIQMCLGCHKSHDQAGADKFIKDKQDEEAF